MDKIFEEWFEKTKSYYFQGHKLDADGCKEVFFEAYQLGKIKNKKKVVQTMLFLPFDSDRFKMAWNEWIIYRKQKKKPLTQLTIQKQLKFLSAFPEKDSIKIIEQSIMNGWTGIFPINHEGPTQGKLSVDVNGRPLPAHLQGFVQ